MPPRRRPRAGGPLHLPAQPALIVNYLPNSVLGQYQGICLSSVPLAPILSLLLLPFSAELTF
jgi:hypothetical protein